MADGTYDNHAFLNVGLFDNYHVSIYYSLYFGHMLMEV